MKYFSNFKPYILLLIFFATVSLLVVYQNLSNPLLCEQAEPYVERNLFFTIEQRAHGLWDVFFRNVNVPYEVSSSTRPGDFQNQNFHFRQTNDPDAGSTSVVDQTRVNNNIRDAVIAHFNSIQRGEVHPNLANAINPNAHGRGTMGINSPLDQFSIRDYLILFLVFIGPVAVSLPNMGVYLTVSAYSASALHLIASNYNRLIANLWSISPESMYATIHGIVINQINAIKGQTYFPFIYVLFIFILVNNLVGMVPYSFSSTSHFILTFFISFTVVIGSTLLGLQLHHLIFFAIFVPSGCPLGLLPLLVLIEFISYLARNVSLGLRLAANILSGHMLLNILSGFTYNIMISGYLQILFSLIPLAFVMAFSALETGIAFIQAQVFAVLSSSYVKDGLDTH